MAKSRGGSQAYFLKLQDPRWQQMRLRIMERDGWACQLCGDKDVTLTVHHRQYEFGREPWDYPLNYLVTLCKDCHDQEHELKEDATALLKYSLATGGWFFGDYWELSYLVKVFGENRPLYKEIQRFLRAHESDDAIRLLREASRLFSEQASHPQQNESPEGGQ